MPMRDGAGNRLGQGEWRETLDRLLVTQRPDVLHANSLSMARLAGPVARHLGIPSLGHLRDIMNLSARAIYDVNCNTRILAVSQAVRKYHVNAGVGSDKTHVLHNGVDLVEFRPQAPTGYLHAELGLRPNQRLVGTVGQIALRKGLDVLARAAIRVARNRRDVHFLLIGQRWSDKEESRQLERQLRRVAANQLPGQMHFLGFRDDVNHLLNELALVVHAAREEPLGRVLLEAAASGVPVVATDVGGTSEIFPPHTHAARLVPSDDDEVLAQEIDAVLADEPLRAAMGASARRRAEIAFDRRVAASALVAHYREVLGGKGA
jgi:glycosyltransferase involved in cell wall biosynthesis